MDNGGCQLDTLTHSFGQLIKFLFALSAHVYKLQHLINGGCGKIVELAIQLQIFLYR
ncbi:hypothetical protein D3C71_2160940 [compost metagenome]